MIAFLMRNIFSEFLYHDELVGTNTDEEWVDQLLECVSFLSCHKMGLILRQKKFFSLARCLLGVCAAVYGLLSARVGATFGSYAAG